MKNIKYRKIEKEDFGEWLRMRKTLWPKNTEKELKTEMKNIFSSKRQEVFICVDPKDEYAGFVEVSVRNDYEVGSIARSIGYIEGIFVKYTYRKMGVAKELIKMAEKWAKEKGCKEMGSDTKPQNKTSRAFHKKMGYKETDIIVQFSKRI
ncbi:MAG: aminoglycoside 6'-N-acetyltransferase [Parcubacteria group bacterium]|jgi:aminoglycoside 6'-N-acetyltransferase I